MHSESAQDRSFIEQAKRLQIVEAQAEGEFGTFDPAVVTQALFAADREVSS
jgi:hypothetical protein